MPLLKDVFKKRKLYWEQAFSFTMLLMKILYFFLGLITVLCACTPLPHKNSFAYITNQGDNTVSVISITNGDIVASKVVSTITVGKAPVGVAVSSMLHRAFITNVDSSDISVIDTNTNQVVDTIKTGGSPVGIALAPNHQALYVADWYSDRILEINTADYKQQREVIVTKAPAGLIVSPDSKTLYVAARDSNEIVVIDTGEFAITKRVTVGKHPFGLTLSADGSTLYSVNVVEKTVSIIHTSTWQQSKIKVGEHPYCAVASPDNKTLYVTNTQDDTVSIIDLASQKTIATLDVGMTPEGISYDAASKQVLVASWGENKVSSIDAKTNKLKSDIKTGDKSRAFGQFILPEQ